MPLGYHPGLRGTFDKEADAYLAEFFYEFPSLFVAQVLPSAYCARYPRYLTISFIENETVVKFSTVRAVVLSLE